MSDKNLEAMLMGMLEPEKVRASYLRGGFNYMGSKLDSLPHILEHLPVNDTFCDVFGGSGTVLLNRPISPLEVFNDRHSGIAAFYKALQTNPDELMEKIKLMPHSREYFDWAKNGEVDDDILRGAKWYYTASASFAGRGEYYGRMTKGIGNIWRKIQDLEHFSEIHARLVGVQIENLDYEQMFEDYDSTGTVWYLDPPYYGSNVYEHKMDREAHISMCVRIFNLSGFVALSGYNNEVYRNFPWDSIYQWPLKQRCTTSEGSTNRAETRIEYLFIKEAE